jgi:hypothetical protein
MKKAEKVFVRVKFKTVRVLKENLRLWHLHVPTGSIDGYEDQNGVECSKDGYYELKQN